MTTTLFASGIATGTIGSEQFLSNVNQVGQFAGIIDLSNMQNGDVLELRAYQTVLAGGTARVVDFQGFYGAQLTDQLIVQWGFPINNDLTDAQALRYSLKQTFGTARQYNWKVINIENFPTNFTSFLINSVGQVATFSGTTTSVANAVTVGTNNDKTGYSLSSPQNFNLIGNISGTVVGNVQGTVSAVQGGTVTVSGTVISSVVQGGFVSVTGTVVSSVVQGGTVTVSGTVTVGTNNDKSGYSLSSPQTFNLIGNVSGTWVGNQTGTFLGNRIGNISGSVGAVQVVNDKVNYQLLNNQVVNFSGTITNVYNVLNQVSVSGSVASVVGAVGSVTGNVGGNVVGSVGSVVGLNPALLDVAVSSRMASGTVTVGVNNDKTNYFLANNQIINFSGTITNVMNVINPVVAGVVTGTVTIAGLNVAYLDTYVSSRMASGTVVVGTNNDKNGYGLNTGTFIQSVVNGVWDEQIASHLGVGTTGKSLNSASSAGDPWNTSLPGSYGAGTAGNILASRLATGTFLANLPPTAAQIATETLSEASANPIASNIKKVNDVTLKGDGSATPWGPV